MGYSGQSLIELSKPADSADIPALMLLVSDWRFSGPAFAALAFAALLAIAPVRSVVQQRIYFLVRPMSWI
jgi:hypothetical protein